VVNQATHVERLLVFGILLDGLGKVSLSRSEKVAVFLSLHYVESGAHVVRSPAAEVDLCIVGVETNCLFVVPDRQSKLPLIFVAGNELERPRITRFLSVRVRTIRIRCRAQRIIFGPLNSGCGLLDVSVAGAQLEGLPDSGATSQ